LGVPVALVSLVDSDRQFFKSQIGLPEPWDAARQTPLSHSFCQWVVSSHEPLVISDARKHSVLRFNKAIEDLGVVAYAGIPLTGTADDPIGSFCAIDTNPRIWSENDLNYLQNLAQVAEAYIAVGEPGASQDLFGPDTRTGSKTRFRIIRYIARGISRASEMLSREDASYNGKEQKALLKLIELLGRHLIRLAES
jgi:hypothetical protein